MIISLFLATFTSGILGHAPQDFERPVDTVKVSENRKPYEGRVVFVDKDKVVLRVKSKLQDYDRSKLIEFTSVNEELIAIMPDLKEASYAIDSKGLVRLAKTCEERGLKGEAELVWWNVIRLEPENAEAHEALGHRQVKGNWQAKLTGKWWTMDKIREEKPKWSKGYELHSTHFDVRSNLPWHESVRATLMAEEIYVRMYQSIGFPFGLYWTSRPIQLHLHADNTYDGGGDLRATVDLDSRIVSFDFEDGFQPWLFARHLSEMLLFESMWEMGGGRAEMPQWLAIGMEEALQGFLGLTEGTEQKIDFNPERGHLHNRSVHQGSKKPYNLNRVLNFGAGDFREASHELQRAQAYTLFAYCMYAEDGAREKALMAYFGRVLEGRRSSTDFKDALGIKRKKLQKEFEAAWTEWVAVF